jgi:hypothetical protein
MVRLSPFCVSICTVYQCTAKKKCTSKANKKKALHSMVLLPASVSASVFVHFY